MLTVAISTKITCLVFSILSSSQAIPEVRTKA